ncbi:hypothetical protein HUX88_07860 [Duganella sp. BJB1802]|uniref:hypothetical protein n=1 Tax=unclassified Duganella TaxID=2636909 RepID=UPI0013148D60|nr:MULTISPECIES: hypothetical protein [unclassified Duganella]NVD70474.1 hypothetical protein [Duganella sp. BJB1802]
MTGLLKKPSIGRRAGSAASAPLIASEQAMSTAERQGAEVIVDKYGCWEINFSRIPAQQKAFNISAWHAP